MERETLKSTLYKLIRLGYKVQLEGMEDEKLVKLTLSKQNSKLVNTIMSVEHLSTIYDHHPLGERFIVQILEDLQDRLNNQQA